MLQTMRFIKILFPLLLSAIILISCDNDRPEKINRVVIGISSDIETINPLYSFSVDEGVIDETLFLSLINFEWDSLKGDLTPEPMLADSWEWGADSTSLIIKIKDNVYWSDGKLLTVDDVIYSLELYSDPKTESRMIGTFKNFYSDSEGKIDVNKTFEVISSTQLKINFHPNSVPSILDIVIPIIPKHVFEKINRDQITTSEINFNPVSNSPYKLKKWERNQTIILEANKTSVFYNKGMIDEIIFKIVPDYNSRLLQLKKGELDFCELIKPADVREIIKFNNLVYKTVKGREYDYIGWCNIDNQSFANKNLIVPNKLFGSSKVRLALSHAINNKEILSEYLLNYGQLAVTPISSIFKTLFDSTLQPIEFNPELSKKLLAEEGWIDKDKNGIIEKNNTEFKFTLSIPSGNPLREYAATVVKNNLKAIGIEMNFEKFELGAFIENLYYRKIDAWMASWFIQIPLELKTYWFSDLKNTPLNFAGYQNIEVDKIINQLDKRINEEQRKILISKFQNIIYREQPVTFLYWTDNIVVHNNRLKNVTINPYGALQKLWEWRLE